MKVSKRKKILLFLFTIFLLGFVIPENPDMPVEKATKSDYNPESFWYYPWGRSVTHKGVDIFADKGTNIRSATRGIVLFAGEIRMGGNVVFVLGPKWRLHYYAHMDDIKTASFSFVSDQEVVGTVGDSGNAAGKAPHLHYSLMTMVPYFWNVDKDRQGWKKMFYLDPISYIENK